MAKETKKKAVVDNGLDPKLSQEARLKTLTQRMYMIVGVSIIMLLAFIGIFPRKWSKNIKNK